MELIWCFLASLLAGFGTGLAGLSAATIMVPIMIVLCPTFSKINGVYHATAIALSSDILGSLFTTIIYAKNKNIDLKRGKVLFICVVIMCIIGSIIAYYVDNDILGNFSLILCVLIGLRFILKPETSNSKIVKKGKKLDLKGIIISIFFGVTIGFGTGFFGTGSGMMMLVVFTLFLGMDRKTAVGTSTFIMTFTALIAFVSHVFSDISIITEDLPILILCIVTETIASVLSARFANIVNNKTVSIVTGIILTLTGITMLIINYHHTVIFSFF